jgi:xylan 1,4-beta-xylosidase
MGKYERGVLRLMTAKAREQAGNMPLYYTEWNTSAMLPDSIHDEAYSAAMVAKTIADNDGLVDGYSFWTFSDLFEEHGQYAAPFHGGFGLQNIYGIPKPTYRIFEMLHELGDRRLTVDGGMGSTVELLAVRGDDDLRIMAYNHNILGAEIKTEDVLITLQGRLPGTPVFITRVDAENANPKQKWIELGSPEYPTLAELAEINKASLPLSQEIIPEPSPDGCRIRFSLPPHGVALVSLLQ